MFGRGSLFDMLGDDFQQDPFFRDPIRYMQSQAGFPDPTQELAAWSPVTLPQRRGREVPIEASSSRSARRTTTSDFSIEEVDGNVQTPCSGSSPVVQEPDEGHAADSKQRPGRSQQASAAQLNPLQSFLQDPFRSFFGDQEFSNLTPMTQPGHGSMLFHTSSSFAEHGPDGLQYSQSQSSTFGPQRVTEHQKRVQDTRTGQDEMTISRHLRDKGRTVIRQRQADGSQSQQQRLHNVPEHEAERFDEEWTYEAERTLPMYMRNAAAALPQASRTGQPSIRFKS